MKERRLRLPEVIHISGYKKTKIYNQIKKGEFPRPYKDGTLSYWLESELNQWVADGIENHLGVQKGVQKNSPTNNPN